MIRLGAYGQSVGAAKMRVAAEEDSILKAAAVGYAMVVLDEPQRMAAAGREVAGVEAALWCLIRLAAAVRTL